MTCQCLADQLFASAFGFGTVKSRYFAQPCRPIIVLSFDHSFFLMNIFGKRSDLPFSCKSYRKKEKSVVSFAHEQNAICSPSQTKMDDSAHEQTIIWRQLFGLSANEKQEKFAANDNKSYLQARYFLSNKLDSLVFPFYSWSIVLSLINEICHGQRITLLLALEYCSWSVVNKMYLLTLPGDRWCGILAGLL